MFFRSSRLELFLGKRVQKICCTFTGEQPRWSSISINLLCNLIEITLWHGCSPVNLLRIFRTPISLRTSLDGCFWFSWEKFYFVDFTAFKITASFRFCINGFEYGKLSPTVNCLRHLTFEVLGTFLDVDYKNVKNLTKQYRIKKYYLNWNTMANMRC